MRDSLHDDVTALEASGPIYWIDQFVPNTARHVTPCRPFHWPFPLILPPVPVADIKGLLTGKDCPHMKENKGKQTKVSLLLLLWFPCCQTVS